MKRGTRNMLLASLYAIVGTVCIIGMFMANGFGRYDIYAALFIVLLITAYLANKLNENG